MRLRLRLASYVGRPAYPNKVIKRFSFPHDSHLHLYPKYMNACMLVESERAREPLQSHTAPDSAIQPAAGRAFTTTTAAAARRWQMFLFFLPCLLPARLGLERPGGLIGAGRSGVGGASRLFFLTPREVRIMELLALLLMPTMYYAYVVCTYFLYLHYFQPPTFVRSWLL